ncbi:MAG: glycoside hydrolase family 55 protein [Defluviitaleaceae bacterium]|nr:glycoside hydrolase family 55 protein [Defluviitaleaceae bacterium]
MKRNSLSLLLAVLTLALLTACGRGQGQEETYEYSSTYNETYQATHPTPEPEPDPPVPTIEIDLTPINFAGIEFASGFTYHSSYPVAGDNASINLAVFNPDSLAVHNLHIAGSYVEFSNVYGGAGDEDNVALLVVQYAVPHSVILDLHLNGRNQQLDFTPTASWYDFNGLASFPVLLQPGYNNTIRLGGYAINIRAIAIYLHDGVTPIEGFHHMSLATPTWRLATLNHPRGEPVIYGFDIREFGVEPNSGLDVTAATQAALLSLRAAGGGHLFFPEGHYRFYGPIRIPHGVGIVGDWREPTYDGETVGVVFEVLHGRGQPYGVPFIETAPNASIRGINFWYPNQDPLNIVPYSYTIHMWTHGIWGNDSILVKNCTFINAYKAVHHMYGGLPSVYNVFGTPLNTGVSIDGVGDIGRIDHVYFSPIYWATSGLPGAPMQGTAAYEAMRSHLRTHATAISMGRTDWSFWSHTRIEGYAVGVHIRSRILSETMQPIEPNHFANGQMMRYRLYDNAIALRIDGVSGAGKSFYDFYIASCNDIGIRFGYAGVVHYNLLEAHVAIYNSSIGGRYAALMMDSPARVVALEAEFHGQIQANGGNLMFTNTAFYMPEDYFLVTDGTARRVVFTGCTVNGESASTAATDNRNGALVLFEDDHIQLPHVRTDAPEFRLEPKSPPRMALYVVDVDVTGEICIAQATQAALDQAAEDGGGIVFLPPGNLRLDAPLWVPPGVELSGAVNAPRLPFNNGTILHVYFGRGTGSLNPRERQDPDTVAVAAVNLMGSTHEGVGAGIRGITFNYPQQNHMQPYSFPFTIRVHGADAYIINVSFRNAYSGIDMRTHRSDRHYVEGVVGYVLRNVMAVGSGSTGGRIFYYHMNYITINHGGQSKFGSWPNAWVDGGAEDVYRNVFRSWVFDNHYGLVLGHVQDQFLFGNFTFAGNVGTFFTGDDGIGASGWALGNAKDQLMMCWVFDNLGDMQFINNQLVTVVNHIIHLNLDTQYAVKVKTTENFTGEVVFMNTSFWGAHWNTVVVYGGFVFMGNVCQNDISQITMTHNQRTTDQVIAHVSENGRLHLVNVIINPGSPMVVLVQPDRDSQVDVIMHTGDVVVNAPGVHQFRR